MINKKNQETITFLFKKAWSFSIGVRKKFIAALVLLVLTALTSLFAPLLIALVINEIQQSGITPANVSHLLFLTSYILIAFSVENIFRHAASYYADVSSYFIKNKYKQHLIKRLMSFDLDWHSSQNTGENLSKINRATNGLGAFLLDDGIIRSVISVIAAVVVVLYFDLIVGIIVIFLFIFIVFISLIFDKYLRIRQKELNKKEHKISGKVYDAISNITSLIILRGQKSSFLKIKKHLWSTKEKNYKLVKLFRGKFFFIQFYFDVILVGILLYFIYTAGYSDLGKEAGYIVALYLYLNRAFESLLSYLFFYTYFLKAKTSIEDAEDIEKNIIEKKKNIKNIKDFTNIKIENLNFTYSDNKSKEEKGIKDISLQIKKGEHTAIVGHSGSGKSTLMKIINGLYENARCDITIDNKQFKNIDISNYDLGTTLIPQEPELFSATIHENLTFGSDYSLDLLADMMSLAEFTQVVERLPKKLKSKINERGVNLSGGEKQRLALARGLLFSMEKNILLLDEVTSSVDSQNEVKIYINILKRFKDKTVFASIHKLNLLRFFDKIIILEDGIIQDRGTFEELLVKNEKFKSNWNYYVSKNG